MNRNNRKTKGFTLIELLVVILIIATLAAMIVPRLVGRADDAKRAAAQGDLKILSGLLETFRLDVERYPTTEEGLDALRYEPDDAEGWKGPYTNKDIPMDPWGEPYIYENTGDDFYFLGSFGSDRSPEGEGTAEDIVESEG